MTLPVMYVCWGHVFLIKQEANGMNRPQYCPALRSSEV